MRVAVTGAAGLIGRALVEALAGDERVDGIVAIDRRPVVAGDPKVSVVRRDIGDARLGADLSAVDALVHLAFSDHDVRSTVEANVTRSQNVIGAAIDAGADAIVYASSSSVYGSHPDNPAALREDHPLRPLPFAYPLTKAAVERRLEDLAARHPATRIVRLRPSWVVGPGARVLLGGRAYISLSDYDPPVQVTWIDDAVAAFTAALHDDTASGPYNVGARGTVRSSQIARTVGVRGIRLPYRIRRAAASTATRMRLPGALHPGFVDMDRYPIVLDSSRAESELGWRARCDSDEALMQLRGTR